MTSIPTYSHTRPQPRWAQRQQSNWTPRQLESFLHGHKTKANISNKGFVFLQLFAIKGITKERWLWGFPRDLWQDYDDIAMHNAGHCLQWLLWQRRRIVLKRSFFTGFVIGHLSQFNLERVQILESSLGKLKFYTDSRSCIYVMCHCNVLLVSRQVLG